MNLQRPKGSVKRKITAKVLTVPPKSINLIERTYGQSIEAIEKGEQQKPPANE